MHKSLKIISIILFIVLLAFPVKTEAAFTVSEWLSQAGTWLEGGKSGSPVSEQQVVDIVLPIGQFLVGVGIFVLVGVTIVMGIKYMTSDPNGQAKLKQQMIGIVVAGVIIFAGYNIWKLIYEFMSTITKS